MTKTEYAELRSLYLELFEKGEENRTELEQTQYQYLDKVLTYISLRSTAIKMGNKNPDDNLLIKDAKEKLDAAQKRMCEVFQRTEQG